MQAAQQIDVPVRSWLQKEFTDRCRKNQKYSLRAFAKLLNVDPSSLSQLLSGKRALSANTLNRFCDRLSIPPQTRSELLRKIQTGEENAGTYQQVAADAFAIIADWYHYAILELTFTEGFEDSPNWIGQRLGIGRAEAKIAIERLLRVGLLERSQGKLRKTNAFLTNYEEGFTAPALRELQRQVLQKALVAIDHETPSLKDITSMTMAIDPNLLPEARKRIKKFRRDLCAFMEKGKRTRVFHLGIQLYPVSLSISKIK